MYDYRHGRTAAYRNDESSDSGEDDLDANVRASLRRRRRRLHGHAVASPPAPPPPAPTPAATAVAAADKKKARKRRAPQEAIDRMWAQFSQKRYSMAMTVLPFAPVAASPLSERANELLATSYERTVEECRRKVRKIIQECRRVNMRYRDPGWDIDWDLKMSKGHCLNSLGHDRFDLCISNIVSLHASVPKAVKRVHEIFEKPTFMKNVSGSDVKQGNLGDCWFISCVSGLANVPGGLERTCVECDPKIGIYGFVFFRDGEWIYSIIDDKLYLTSPCWDNPSFQRDLLQQIDREDVERVYRKTYQTGSKALFFAQNKDQNETWLPLMEKAYAKAHGDYDSLTGGWIGEGLEDLTGGVTTELLISDIFDTDSFWRDEISRVNQEFLFGCTTGLLDGGYGERDGITEGHAYNIVEARTLKNGTRLLKLRNPWGKIKTGTWAGAWSDGSKEWTTAVQDELGHAFGNDSVFWIAYEDFLVKYQHIDRTRLFRDARWRCCQRWIGVDVPWKTTYNEKFHIKLTQSSPLVLVLSQLDTRYFHGLDGQYRFRLQFRLHEQGRPGAEDYIVRSHGNYLMTRSVSVELPALDPGNYSVFLSVVAERDAKALSVEDAVRRELKPREENEKLAQVGQAYDLAHSKAAAHMQELAKLRKRADHHKASSQRKAERRKVWAKHHLLKDIKRRQEAKNEEKRKRREAMVKEEENETETEQEESEDKNTKDETKETKEKETKLKETETKEKETETKEKETETKEKETETKEKEAKEAKEKETKETKDDNGSVQQDKDHHSLAGRHDKAVQTEPLAADDDASSVSSGSHTPQITPLDSPKSGLMAAAVDGDEPVAVPQLSAVAGGPPKMDPEDEKGSEDKRHSDKKAESSWPDDEPCKPAEEDKPDDKAKSADKKEKPADKKNKGTDKKSKKTSAADDDSSDSPIENWEEWYSSDDLSTKASRAAAGASTPAAAAAAKDEDDTEDDKDAAPWNAICVVGIRVYSHDENLELRVVMEGGQLLEGGMGEKGEQDLDNAQANAGGLRVKEDGRKTETEEDGKTEKKTENKEQNNEAKRESTDAETAKDKKEKKDKNDERRGDTTVDDGLATYQTIVQKGDEEFLKASAPVETAKATQGEGDEEKKGEKEKADEGEREKEENSVAKKEDKPKEDSEAKEDNLEGKAEARSAAKEGSTKAKSAAQAETETEESAAPAVAG